MLISLILLLCTTFACSAIPVCAARVELLLQPNKTGKNFYFMATGKTVYLTEISHFSDMPISVNLVANYAELKAKSIVKYIHVLVITLYAHSTAIPLVFCQTKKNHHL